MFLIFEAKNHKLEIFFFKVVQIETFQLRDRFLAISKKLILPSEAAEKNYVRGF